jgi:3-hydroxyisobutyrate dehydrogenase-like beta-hydroxyacid dehydrogenase
MYSTANNIATAEICSWLTAQDADPKLFLKLLRTTGSQASAARMEEFMKRNNNHGGALSNSYKDIRQALEVAAQLQIPMPLLSRNYLRVASRGWFTWRIEPSIRKSFTARIG